MNITQFTMEEVRCFSERQTLEIRPLTFLVGENSTGKTTALACFQVLANCLHQPGVDFNHPPYTMGIFKEIVRSSRKKEKTFKLGFTYKDMDENVEWIVEFVEKKEGVEPAVSKMTLKFCDGGSIVFKTSDELENAVFRVEFVEAPNRFQIACREDRIKSPSLGMLLDFLEDQDAAPFLEGEDTVKKALTKYIRDRVMARDGRFGLLDIRYAISVFSTSPIRSQPKRTYDPIRELYDPEGSEIPMYLMRIEATQKKEWETLKQHLLEFGKASGLFQNIELKNFGQALGGPFQLRFKVRGPTCNITDVGYGVSQILPILVHVLNPSIYTATSFFLLQQPEVHLHPRAQAELSSLLAKLAHTGKGSFIVETHSDYMIDRARIEIRKGTIKPDEVSLIYFEPKGNIVNVHNIGFDEAGNLTNVPKHYRKFFLKETYRLMGFED